MDLKLLGAGKGIDSALNVTFNVKAFEDPDLVQAGDLTKTDTAEPKGGAKADPKGEPEVGRGR